MAYMSRLHSRSVRASQPSKSPFEAKAVAAEIAPGVLVKVEGMEGALEAGLEFAQQRVDRAELKQDAGGLPTDDNSLMDATRCGYGTEEIQSTWHMATGRQLLSSPDADCL